MNRIKIFKSNTLRFLEQDINNFIVDKVVKNISMQVSQNDYIVIMRIKKSIKNNQKN